MSFDPYITLGIDRNATAEEIKAAYKRSAAQAHPDREGGANDRMVDVNMAYKILSDPEMKGKYDQGEGFEVKQSVDDRARDTLLQVMQLAIRSEISPYADLIELVRQGVTKQLEGLHQARQKTHDDLARLRERYTRLKGPPENPLHAIIDVEIKRGELYLPRFDADEGMLRRCLEMLKLYSYDCGQAAPGRIVFCDDPVQMVSWSKANDPSKW